MSSAHTIRVPTTPRRSLPASAPVPPVGALLRRWREGRRLSQLDLALQAEISTRHLSFVETGRSRPSRELLLRLAEELDVPLRERNELLLAGGYAPIYPERALDTAPLEPIRAALRQVLAGHEPYPAVVVDRHWTLIEANRGVAPLVAGVAPDLLAPPANVLRIGLHPRGMAPQVRNLGEWRAHLLGRLHRQVLAAAGTDSTLTQLEEELRAYPGGEQAVPVAHPGPGDIVAPLRFRPDGTDRDLAFLSTVTTFGAPLDITVAELVIEAFYPADATTADYLRAQTGTDTASP